MSSPSPASWHQFVNPSLERLSRDQQTPALPVHGTSNIRSITTKQTIKQYVPAYQFVENAGFSAAWVTRLDIGDDRHQIMLSPLLMSMLTPLM
jgi:hypothetical protein